MTKQEQKSNNHWRLSVFLIATISLLAAFTWQRKRYWLIPILIALLGVGALVLFSEGSTLSYFIYPLF